MTNSYENKMYKSKRKDSFVSEFDEIFTSLISTVAIRPIWL